MHEAASPLLYPDVRERTLQMSPVPPRLCDIQIHFDVGRGGPSSVSPTRSNPHAHALPIESIAFL